MTPPIIDDESIRQIYDGKQSKISVGRGSKPLVSDLAEGNPLFRYIPNKGMYLFLRFNNKLYWTKMISSDVRKLGLENDGIPDSADRITDSNGDESEHDIATLTNKINEIIDRI